MAKIAVSYLIKGIGFVSFDNLIQVVDKLVKNMKRRFSVIPRRPESSSFKLLQIFWIPVSTGVTTFYEAINLKSLKFLSEGKLTL